MLIIASRLDVTDRPGQVMVGLVCSRILLTLFDGPSYPTVLSHDLDLAHSNTSNHLICLCDCGIVVAEPGSHRTHHEIAGPHPATVLDVLAGVTLAADKNTLCVDPECLVPNCDGKGTDA